MLGALAAKVAVRPGLGQCIGLAALYMAVMLALGPHVIVLEATRLLRRQHANRHSRDYPITPLDPSPSPHRETPSPSGRPGHEVTNQLF
jgi:hypothetical protein